MDLLLVLCKMHLFFKKKREKKGSPPKCSMRVRTSVGYVAWLLLLTIAYLVLYFKFSFFFHHLKGQSRWNGCSCRRRSNGSSLLSQIRESELWTGGQYPWTRRRGCQRWQRSLLVTNMITNFTDTSPRMISKIHIAATKPRTSLLKRMHFSVFVSIILWYYQT